MTTSRSRSLPGRSSPVVAAGRAAVEHHAAHPAAGELALHCLANPGEDFADTLALDLEERHQPVAHQRVVVGHRVEVLAA
jgi:hypothetical protein